MKKLAAVMLSAVMLVSLTACGSSSAGTKVKSSSKTMNDLVSEANAASAANSTEAPLKDKGYPQLDYEAEIDLTAMGSTMVYSEVYNMMVTPDDYNGKKVKCCGQFSVYTDINTNNLYFACLIADAAACCSQGLEFIWEGDHTYPEDYPLENQNITVGGVFETYEENGATYCRLKDAVISF